MLRSPWPDKKFVGLQDLKAKVRTNAKHILKKKNIKNRNYFFFLLSLGSCPRTKLSVNK